MGALANGAFAQYVKVLTRKIYAVPKNVIPQLAALTKPVAVAVHDVRRSDLKSALIMISVGLIAMVARHANASDVLISEISENYCKKTQSLGFDVINPLAADFKQQIM